MMRAVVPLLLLLAHAAAAAETAPRLLFATYAGGSQLEFAGDVAFDPDGNIVICGSTASRDVPWILGAPKAVDAYVAKLSGDGSRVLWAKFFGGSQLEDTLAMTIDAKGTIYVAGRTDSPDFPVTADAVQKELAGGIFDGYLAKFSPGGDLLYATYFGGSGGDAPDGIAVDLGGNVVIAGDTSSKDYPLRNPFQATNRGGTNLFVTRFAAGGDVIYSTYIGSTASDAGHAVAVDLDGNAYVIGVARGADFPTTADTVQPTYGGAGDAVVVKLAPDGALLFSTFLGGSGFDGGDHIAVAGDGIWVTGRTESSDLAVVHPLQPLGGRFDAFLMKLSRDGKRLLASTFLGGAENDFPIGMTTMAEGSVAVCGETRSIDFPLRRATQPRYGGSDDGFVTVVAPDLRSIVFSTYIGGGGMEICSSVAGSARNVLAVAGTTISFDFPIANALQPATSGPQDDYAAAIDLGPLLAPPRRRPSLPPR